ncbi:MAG: hypothetical protein FK730_14975 [Asgard group archaeon]|jgi:hypothetical protein|nr:hypothetical protein [Asgard group archaeon]
MTQPSAKTVVIVMLLVGVITIPGLIYAIIQITIDPTYTLNYVYLVSSIFIIALVAGYIIRLFAFGGTRIPPESDY